MDNKRRRYKRCFITNQHQHNRAYPSHPIYDNAFYGYLFKYNQYGYKAARCRSNIMHRNYVNQSSFNSMLYDNVTFFRSNCYGNREANCTTNIIPKIHIGRNLYAPQIEYDV